MISRDDVKNRNDYKIMSNREMMLERGDVIRR